MKGGTLRQRRWWASAIALVIMSLVIGSPTARASVDFVIQAGAEHPTAPDKPFEYTRFYPSTLQIHRGQTVTWQIIGFHSVTFMPAGGPDRPPHFRTDEVSDYFNFDEGMWRPTGCGQAGEMPCLMDDTDSFISSGTPPFNPSPEFSVTVDLPIGTYRYICTVHVPMRGTIEVVDDTVPIRSQSDIDAQTATDIATDSTNADALDRQDPGFSLEGDRRIWNVLLGDATVDNHVALNAFIPSGLNVAVGDGVRFFFRNGAVNEIHTVSFPAELSGGREPTFWGKSGFGIHPRCDLDDPFTGLPGIPGPFVITPLPCPGTVEFGLAPWMTTAQRAPGDAVLPGAIHDSAIMIPAGTPDSFRALPGTDRFFPVDFSAGFPLPGLYSYKCNVHPDAMVGSVTVS